MFTTVFNPYNALPTLGAIAQYPPLPPFPGFAPLPPPPVPPGGLTPDTFDLSAVDTATEALVMPGSDLLVNLLVAGSSQRSANVSVVCGQQRVDYRQTPNEISGQVNGAPFSVPVQNAYGATYMQGNTPAGPLSHQTVYQGPSSTAKGQVGTIAYDQTYSQDPSLPMTGHAATWTGTVNDQSFGIDITRSCDGNGFQLSGYVGDRPMRGKLVQLDANTVVIERNVSGNLITQTVRLG